MKFPKKINIYTSTDVKEMKLNWLYNSLSREELSLILNVTLFESRVCTVLYCGMTSHL